MKRRWKKFLAGVLSAALALNLAAPLALADSVGCTVAGRVLSGEVDSVTGDYIQGKVSYLNNTLTFDGDVKLDTRSSSSSVPLIQASSGNTTLTVAANGTVEGWTKSRGFNEPKEITGGKYIFHNTDWNNTSKGILGATNLDKTTVASDTEITLDGFQTGIGWGSVQINGKVKITNATYGIANFTTMNPGSELEIHAQQYIGEHGHLTYSGGHLLLNVTTIGMDFGLSRLGIGENVGNIWYRTSKNDAFTKIDTNVQQGIDDFYAVKEQNPVYLELTDVDPDQQQSENYDLWVAGTQVTKTNQSNVLDDGTVSYDPNTHTLTLNNAHLTPDGDANFTYCIDSKLTDVLTITGTATLSNAIGIMTTGPLTLDNANLTLTGDSGEEDGGVMDAIQARDKKDITIQNSKVTIAGTIAGRNFFQYGIRCGKLTVANSTLDVKASGGSAIAADTMEVSGADTIVLAESDSTDEEEYYALALDDETSLTLRDGLALVAGKVNESKTAKIARPEQVPTDFKVYWVVHPGDEPVNGGMQFPGAIIQNDDERHLFAGWFLEDGTRLEDSPYYMGPGADHVGNLDRDVTFYGHWRTAESGEGSGDGGDGFGTLLRSAQS